MSLFGNYGGKKLYSDSQASSGFYGGREVYFSDSDLMAADSDSDPIWWPRSIFFRFRFRPHGGRLRFRPYGGRFRLLGHHSYNMSRRRSGRREVGIGIGHHRVGIGVGRHEVGIGIGKIYFSATICFTALTNVFEPFQNVQKIIVTCEPQNGHAGTNFAGDWRVLDWSKLLSRARNLFLKTSSVNAK